jgi:GT2 family glycosyltransferase
MIKVLTLTWNGNHLLNNLKDGLIKNLNKTGLPWAWFIRSNGCKDETIENFSNVENVYLQKMSNNIASFAQGVNSLALFSGDIARSEDDYYLLLNNDIAFKDDMSLSNMISLLKDDVAIVGARLLYPGTNKLQHAGVIFSKKYNNMPWHYRASEESDSEAMKNREFQAVTGACLLTKANTYNEIKLDERFMWAFEDIAYCLSVKSKGKKVVYCGKTEMEHGESVSLKKNPVNKLMMPSNVKNFKDNYVYSIDHDLYLNNKNYNEVC